MNYELYHAAKTKFGGAPEKRQYKMQKTTRVETMPEEPPEE